MIERTFGWVQDAGRLSSLRKAVKVFELGRVSALESKKIVRKALDIGRWADETYVKFAEALGFIEWVRETDDFAITDLGIDLLKSKPGSNDEKQIFERGLLFYPPACRVLGLLVNNEVLTKFEIGEKLGFQKERGFPHYPQEDFIKEYDKAGSKKEKNKIISNRESTIDKYARMIAGYLIQMGWVKQVRRKLEYEEDGIRYVAETPHAYRITPKGRTAYRKVIGSSTQRKIIKNVSFGMLASGKQPGYSLLRKRRALILEFLLNRRGKLVSIGQIMQFLNKNEIKPTEEEIRDDMKGLINTGILIREVSSNFVLTEDLNKNFPLFKSDEEKLMIQVQVLVNRLRTEITEVDKEFIGVIIKEAYGGSRFAKNFEKSVYKLFNEILGFEGIPLGGSREPDSLFWYIAKSKNGSYGLIVDTKAYSTGFKVTSNMQRAMVDYIYNFRPILKREHEVKNIYYVWVTSFYAGTERKFRFHVGQIKKQSNTDGCLLPIQEGLVMAKRIASSKEVDALLKIEPLFSSNTVISKEAIKKRF